MRFCTIVGLVGLKFNVKKKKIDLDIFLKPMAYYIAFLSLNEQNVFDKNDIQKREYASAS
jgi:hypothetical protein